MDIMARDYFGTKENPATYDINMMDKQLQYAKQMGIGDYTKNPDQVSELGRPFVKFANFGHEKSLNKTTYLAERADFTRGLRTFLGDENYKAVFQDMNKTGIPIGNYLLQAYVTQQRRAIFGGVAMAVLQLGTYLAKFVSNPIISSSAMALEQQTNSYGFEFGLYTQLTKMLAGLLGFAIFATSKKASTKNKAFRLGSEAIGGNLQGIMGKGAADATKAVAIIPELAFGAKVKGNLHKTLSYNRSTSYADTQANDALSSIMNYFYMSGEVWNMADNMYLKSKHNRESLLMKGTGR
jgi:hypothetical protein